MYGIQKVSLNVALHNIIKVSSLNRYQPLSRYAATPYHTIPKAFCNSSYHSHCPNHYSTFHIIPRQRRAVDRAAAKAGSSSGTTVGGAFTGEFSAAAEPPVSLLKYLTRLLLQRPKLLQISAILLYKSQQSYKDQQDDRAEKEKDGTTAAVVSSRHSITNSK